MLKVEKFASQINFYGSIEHSNSSVSNIKTELEKTPDADNFQCSTKAYKQKKHLVRNIILGGLSAIALVYGGIVLKRKLNKPSFEEVQKCFKEIFQKDLSEGEVKDILAKYKEICKNGNTDDFTNKMIEQLKKDYGIEKVETKINIEKLKDGSLKTALEATEYGSATPLGEIKIIPHTNSENIIRSIQCETFQTGFHELKHMKQFAEAYRANPDKFAEAIIKHIKPEEFTSALERQKNAWKEWASKLHNCDEKTLTETYEKLKKRPQYKNITLEDLKREYRNTAVDEIYKLTMEKAGCKTDDDILMIIKENTRKLCRQALDERYGKLERFKEGSDEYLKGMEYIKGYENYSNPKDNYQAYKENILEKEAFGTENFAKKIYRYVSSIWKL